MFKGYVKTNGKIPLEKIKTNNDLCTYDQIIKLDCDYGGVLREDIIMVDVDNMGRAIKLKGIIEEEKINCNILKTSRGYHFYFKNTKVYKNFIDTKCPIGINADFKLGNKNTVVPLRIEGTEREFIGGRKEGNELDYLPIWLIPMKKAKDFSNSHTRNNDLYTYILSLQSDGFVKEEVLKILKIINKYILPIPLSQEEFDTIVRDDSFNKPCFFIKDKLQHNVFSKWLIEQYHIIKINSCLHYYNAEKCQYEDIKGINKIIIDEIDHLRKTQRQEVINYLNDYIFNDTPQASSNYVNVKNGILDINTWEIKEHSPNMIITNKIETEYHSDAYHELTDKTLDKMACGNKELRLLFEEIVGYCLLRRNELGKFFVLTGDGGGGKSTFLEMLTKMLGDSNVSSVSLQDLSDRFLKTDTVGMLANIGDDISDIRIEDNSNLKKLVTGESVQFQAKFQDAFNFKSYTKFLFASNEIPRVNDSSQGFMRRLVIIPFNAKFTKNEDYDPYIGDKLKSKEALEYLLKMGIDGLKRVLKNKKFTECEKIVQEAKEYEIYNNSLLGFIEEGAQFENVFVDDFYRQYCIWCADNGLRPKSKNKISRELISKFGIQSCVERVNGKIFRMYKRCD